jgi:Na+/phosphate symporter
MSKTKELNEEVVRLRSLVEKLKVEGLQLLKDKDVLKIALEASKLQIDNLDKKIKEYERLLK